MEYLIIIVLSYIFGAVNPAHLITKRVKKIDIRDVNSKNAGTSNVAMTIGLKYAVPVALIDMLKGFIPVLIVRLVFQDNDILWVIAGLSAIIGHVYPIHMGFRGGKGTATYGGVCFGLFPLVTLFLFISFFIVLKVSDYIVIPTVLAVVLIPVGMLFTSFHPISAGLMALYTGLSLYKHWPNIVRLIRREEVGLKEAFKKE